jgi:hypothetical protein
MKLPFDSPLCRLSLLLMFLAGCGLPDGGRARSRELSFDTGRELRYVAGLPPASTRYVLVAGDSSSVVFLSEVLSLRRSLIAAGVAPERIAVFYALPDTLTSVEKLEAWRPFALETRDCYLATMQNLRDCLAVIGRDAAKEEAVFLYVTSHGNLPLSLRMILEGEGRTSSGELDALRAAAARQPLLDDWSLAVRGAPVRSLTSRELWSLAAGAEEPGDYLCTPTTFHKLLDEMVPEQRQVVVLSGCYSGGFVVQPEEFATQTLGRNGRVVLTASDWDRASFGCGMENDSTYFGRHFGRLVETAGDPLRIDAWQRFYRTLCRAIADQERAEKVVPSKPRLSVDGVLVEVPE